MLYMALNDFLHLEMFALNIHGVIEEEKSFGEKYVNVFVCQFLKARIIN